MKTVAAVLVETGQPLVLTELEIPPLKPGQVLVEIAYSGVCHTQLLECRGYRGEDPYLPHCLGHEGSGVVCDVGADVNKVKPGEQVILSWIKGCGADVAGTVYRWDGRQVNAGGITTFSCHAVISENRLTPIPEDVDMRHAALLGCAVPTGMGAVFNTAQARPGQSLAIFGTGGVGLCAVAGATITGCAPIIAVDVRQSKLDIATKMGATHVVDATKMDPVQAIQQICEDGADFSIEATGRPDVMVQALRCVRSQGGVAVVVGNAHHGELIHLDPRQLNLGKQLRGSWGGDTSPDRDFRRYCGLLQDGSLDLALLSNRIYSLNNINDAIADLADGTVARPLIALRQ
jgi:S-(hydroxymethyl)glutathione dehydrogenase/alcohol dehydrogenase